MLKAWDGFDHYTAIDDLLARSDFIQYQKIGVPTVSFIAGLAAGAGKALRIVSGNGFSRIRAVYTARNAEAFLAWRWRVPTGQPVQTAPSGTYFVFWDTIADAAQVTVYFNEANYAIQIYRGNGMPTGGGTLLYTSSNNVWVNDTAQFLEIGLKIDNSTGYVTVKLGEVTVATVTGVDTQATANAWFDAVDVGPSPITGSSVGSYADIDDHRYNDNASDSGVFANNSFMGDAGVKTLFMTGNGTVQFTPLSGSNYAQINEQAMDSDTSYNYSSTPGQEDAFTAGTITNVITVIYGVRITIAARKDDVGPRVLKTGLKSGATTSYGANHSLPDTYAYFCDNWILDPNTGANWTRVNVNAVLPRYNLVS
jgi:hypothetical protein